MALSSPEHDVAILSFYLNNILVSVLITLGIRFFVVVIRLGDSSVKENRAKIGVSILLRREKK